MRTEADTEERDLEWDEERELSRADFLDQDEKFAKAMRRHHPSGYASLNIPNRPGLPMRPITVRTDDIPRRCWTPEPTPRVSLAAHA